MSSNQSITKDFKVYYNTNGTVAVTSDAAITVIEEFLKKDMTVSELNRSTGIPTSTINKIVASLLEESLIAPVENKIDKKKQYYKASCKLCMSGADADMFSIEELSKIWKHYDKGDDINKLMMCIHSWNIHYSMMIGIDFKLWMTRLGRSFFNSRAGDLRGDTIEDVVKKIDEVLVAPKIVGDLKIESYLPLTIEITHWKAFPEYPEKATIYITIEFVHAAIEQFTGHEVKIEKITTETVDPVCVKTRTEFII